MKKDKTKKKNKEDTDKSVDEMIKNWDKVKCHICGKEISMLDAIFVSHGQYFKCRDHNDD